MTTRATKAAAKRPSVRKAAEAYFGHARLRPGQKAVVEALLDGHDVLLVAPTGAGKSLTYQLGGLLLGGCTVVVSPLLALQVDQLRRLEELDPAPAAARISSAESVAEREEVLAQAEAGELDFLFLSPEQLASDEVRARLAEIEPTLVAVDEAHCVSTWGHDFRPDYFRLGDLVAEMGKPRVVAMTATAAPPVREDIVERLHLEDHRLVVSGFRRDNLALSVVRAVSADAARETVLDLVGRTEGPGIVYSRTRRLTEELAEAVTEGGRRAVCYHAGLSGRRRDEAYEAFMNGEVEVIVATSAFGMGVDKPDIRWVVHAQAPEAPDTYYQEVGRAGRDGEPAEVCLVYRPEDLSLGRFFVGGVPDLADVRRVRKAVAKSGGDDRGAVQGATGLGPRKVGRILNLLELARTSSDEGADEAKSAVERAEAQQRLDKSRVEMMRTYAETTRCRTEWLQSYFGEEDRELCGRCDNCVSGVAEAPAAPKDGPAVHTYVDHPEFGRGTVADIEDDRVTVLFEDVGYKTLSLEIVTEQGLLDEVAASSS